MEHWLRWPHIEIGSERRSQFSHKLLSHSLDYEDVESNSLPFVAGLLVGMAVRGILALPHHLPTWHRWL
jgi:putative transposase